MAGPGRGLGKRPPKVNRNPTCTPLEKLFAMHCIDEPNRSDAYRKAGGTAKNASHAAAQMMQQQRVVDEIARLQAEQFKRLEMKSDEALALAAGIARACIGDAFEENGSLVPPSKWNSNLRIAVTALESEELFVQAGEGRAHVGTVRKIKLSDKIAALTLIMRKHGLLKDKVEHSATDSFAALVLRGQRLRQEKMKAAKAAKTEGG